MEVVNCTWLIVNCRLPGSFFSSLLISFRLSPSILLRLNSLLLGSLDSSPLLDFLLLFHLFLHLLPLGLLFLPQLSILSQLSSPLLLFLLFPFSLLLDELFHHLLLICEFLLMTPLSIFTRSFAFILLYFDLVHFNRLGILWTLANVCWCQNYSRISISH